MELITDNMVGYFMSKGLITHVVVGADRITANGDVANKIGTYTVSVLAREHGVPFYVAAPFSTVDLALPDGSAIPIEERAASEVTGFGSARWAPAGVKRPQSGFRRHAGAQRVGDHHRPGRGIPAVWIQPERSRGEGEARQSLKLRGGRVLVGMVAAVRADWERAKEDR